MRHPALIAFLWAIALATPATPKGIELDSREYKLMLRTERFAGDAGKAVDDFWKALALVIQGPPNNLKAKHEPVLDKKRLVRYFDTKDCMLDRSGYALRLRHSSDAGAAANREVTLKLRAPDVVLVSLVKLKGREGNHPSSKFEEDITALGEADVKSAPEATLPRRSRSLFSRSTKQTVEGNPTLKKLSDVRRLYPDLSESLEQIVDVDWNAEIIPGRLILEHVYDGAVADLGKKVNAEVSVTLWYAGDASVAVPAGAKPEVAEVSFKYDVDNPEDPFKAALRADRLFASMQGDLADWIDPAAANKTSLGLPMECS
jgi:hypothetical protein